IGLEQHGQGDESLDAGKQAILDVLHKTFSTPDAGGKPDFNSVPPSALPVFLTQKDPLNLGAAAGDRYNQLAIRLTAARDRDYGGIVNSFHQFNNVETRDPGGVATPPNNFF